MNNPQIGQKYVFDYPPEFETLPEYSAKRGAIVEIIEPCPPEEADEIWDDPDGSGNQILVDKMYRVRAEDGTILCAWDSELQLNTEQG